MSADYTLGFVQRDGVMHDERHYGDDLYAAIHALGVQRYRSNPHWIHWYVYDAEDPERGYFDSADAA